MAQNASNNHHTIRIYTKFSSSVINKNMSQYLKTVPINNILALIVNYIYNFFLNQILIENTFIMKHYSFYIILLFRCLMNGPERQCELQWHFGASTERKYTAKNQKECTTSFLLLIKFLELHKYADGMSSCKK